MARKEFVGWTGLPPIAELIEFIIGIRGDYVNQQIIWDMNLTETNGIERYPFGSEGIINLKAEARRSAMMNHVSLLIRISVLSWWCFMVARKRR